MTTVMTPPHADAVVRSISPAAHVARALGRRVVQFAGAGATAAYDRRFYPQRFDEAIEVALPRMRAPQRAGAVARRGGDVARRGGDVSRREGDVSRRGEGGPRVPHVVQVIGSLGAGGAERQLASFIAASQRSGLVRHTVITCHPAVGAAGHYRRVLEDAGVEIRTAGARLGGRAAERIRGDRALRRRMFAIPLSLGHEPVEIAGEFLDLEPDFVHAWLDHTNIFAGAAALVTGAPEVILSLRSLAPTHIPAMLRDWMLPWYRVLAREDHVRLVANSEAGADDYARWIGIARDRIGVVRNGFDAEQFASPTPTAVERVRTELGAAGRPLVLGVFRVGDEKNPHHFVHVARRVLARRPDCVFAVAGDGPMLGDLRRFTEDLGGSLVALGRRDDIPALIAAADAMLLCSRVEGLPNVLVEAQALGCPVVATDAGGTRETMQPGTTGFLRKIGDIDGLTDDILRLLGDPPLRSKVSAEAQAFARGRFPLERMVRETHALYGVGDGGI